MQTDLVTLVDKEMIATDQPTVFVVEDDPAVRETLTDLVTGVSLLVQCFGSAEEFLEQYDPSRPGCLVLDVRMPGMTGIELQERLTAEKSLLPIIIITGHGDVPMTVRAMKQGAFDFLEKPYRPSQLLESISKALQLDASRRQKQSQRQKIESRIQCLTSEERDVLRGIVAGRTNEAVAQQLDVSLRTVQYRRASLMKKLDVDTKAELLDLFLPHAAYLQQP